MTKTDLESRVAELRESALRQRDNLNATSGALQFAEALLSAWEEAPKKPRGRPKLVKPDGEVVNG